MKNKHIQTSDYPIYFGSVGEELSNFLASHSWSKIVILTDTNTSSKCLPVLNTLCNLTGNYDIIEIDAGEENKNIDICIGIWSMMNDFEMDRHSLLINLGGGMISDIGGFAASAFKRGIDFIHIPTSLLSMTDAAIGGKTGIDFNLYKNSIGTFATPRAVFIDPLFLNTLSRRDFNSGWVEMIKHGLIANEIYFQKLIQNDQTTDLLSNIYQSVEIKTSITEEDPKEQGKRKVLNFGHTIGHAIETYSLQQNNIPLLHGEAIAIGMICEALLSNKIGSLTTDELNQVTKYLIPYCASYTLAETEYPLIINILKKDKKNKGDLIYFALLDKIGQASYDHIGNEEDLIDALKFYHKLVTS